MNTNLKGLLLNRLPSGHFISFLLLHGLGGLEFFTFHLFMSEGIFLNCSISSQTIQYTLHIPYCTGSPAVLKESGWVEHPVGYLCNIYHSDPQQERQYSYTGVEDLRS